MKTNYALIKLFLSGLFIGLFSCLTDSSVFAQDRVINFESKARVKDIKEATHKNARFNRAVKGFGKSLELRGNGAFFQIKVGNISKIDFVYSKARAGDDIKLIVTRINKGKEYESASFLLKGGALTNYEMDDYLLDFKPLSGGDYIRFKLDGNLGKVLIDDIKIFEVQDSKVKELDKQADQEKQAQIILEKIRKEGLQKCEQIIKAYPNIDEEYAKGLKEMNKILYKARIAELIAKLTSYYKVRADIGNPIVYEEFTTALKSINVDKDPLIANQVTSFNDQLTNLKFRNQKKRSVFGKIFGVIGNVANIVTGGQINGVLNGVKGLITNVFNENTSRINILMREKFKKIRYENDKINKAVKQRTNNGQKLIKKITDFANIAEKEYKDYSEEIVAIIEATDKAEALSKKSLLFIKEYLSDVKITVDNTTINNFGRVKDNIDSYRAKIKNYIRKHIPDCNKKSKKLEFYTTELVQLERFKRNLSKKEKFYIDYKTLSNDIKITFKNAKNKLEEKAKKNPFDKKKYPESHQKFKNMLSNSQSLLDEVINALDRVFPAEKE